MKLIAVSQRVDLIGARAERRDALDQRMPQWLMSAGYIPVPVPNLLCQGGCANHEVSVDPLFVWLNAVKPMGVLLSGGNDIGECLERDETENALLQWAEERLMPVLGICRGMQMMGVRSGGHLKKVSCHVHGRHVLQGDFLSGTVNSYHNYALADCPSGFNVVAKSEDGEIEAIRHMSLPWEGWMWHPEREANFQLRDMHRVRKLFG